LQLNDPSRGFSFQTEGPLDMRLGSQQSETALSYLERTDEKDLTDLFIQFGEGRNARRLSRYLLSDVAQGKIKTTKDLAGFCERVLGRRGSVHPATRVFLALRAAVNRELETLKNLLQEVPRVLKRGGRLAVVSFHSLEDRLVKESFRNLGQEGLDQKKFSVLTKKPIGPSPHEIKDNPRSRSAKLRGLERTE
jgi:16S rRNA (cytosine1402-N4)-methyltransferase